VAPPEPLVGGALEAPLGLPAAGVVDELCWTAALACCATGEAPVGAAGDPELAPGGPLKNTTMSNVEPGHAAPFPPALAPAGPGACGPGLVEPSRPALFSVTRATPFISRSLDINRATSS